MENIEELKKEDFPFGLNEIPEPPKKIYIKGKLPPIGSIYLTIVGSRKYTSYGRDACEMLIEGLRGYPIVIVSGLALGIDTIAHKAAMRAGLKTVAFPGSGLSNKNLYPYSNRGLADSIITQGGCLVSEFEPEQSAAIWTFPRRNRLMAGISKAVLIIEAEEKSGTRITARLATEYNRDVLVVPGSIFSPVSKGTNSLIRLGATPITNSNELLEALGFSVEKKEDINRELEDCSQDEKIILEFLSEPKARDEVLRTIDKSVTEINSILSVLEIKGLIKEEFGEIIRI
ncbi:DNA-protecting protein DprA [Candidatus Nomurabacteria bacterium]|nr:MAG: DNA-protecting protein DprA [Candidatus Nomurabacteria bacterium]